MEFISRCLVFIYVKSRLKKIFLLLFFFLFFFESLTPRAIVERFYVNKRKLSYLMCRDGIQGLVFWSMGMSAGSSMKMTMSEKKTLFSVVVTIFASTHLELFVATFRALKWSRSMVVAVWGEPYWLW